MTFSNLSRFLLTASFFWACNTSETSESLRFDTTFETSKGIETATYEEVIDFYLALSRSFSSINVQTIGQTDSGFPLHLVTYNPDGEFNFSKIRESKSVLLINNGIHPGESDGIDATMMLFRDLATADIESPENVGLATIPVYNVGGMRNRNATSRANQNGPLEYGFRGNARNYDLNRDFIKMDSENAKTFAQIFHLVKPAVFIDNHVSNGADYQYTLTHLFTQHNKLGGASGAYLHNSLVPKLEAGLAKAEWDITPYVNVFNRSPESGFSQFHDHPRYSTGYTTLWNTLGMMVETHMLKPYKQRVEGTYALMKIMLDIVEEDHETIVGNQEEDRKRNLALTQYHLNWQKDTTRHSSLQFKGFKVDTLTSKVTGLPRLKYDRDKPFTKTVRYDNYEIPSDTIEVPAAYVIKKAWSGIIERLSANAISFYPIPQDTSLRVESYRIADYGTSSRAYEGHYLHYNTKVETNEKSVFFEAGDILVPLDQEGARYLLETLEPNAPDSFFNWNFFDTILQQKEGFSPYVFEDVAAAMLEADPELQAAFSAKRATEPEFAANWYAQLDYLFKRSKHYESAHLQYPIYRIVDKDLTAGLLSKWSLH